MATLSSLLTANNGLQATLVSGTNIKTVNSTSVLGSGNIAVEPTITAGTTSQYWRGDKTWQTLDKAAVGLGSVENTALSSWAGVNTITTVGTIATGTWNATVIADGKIATALTGKTYNGLTLTAAATGFTVAGGTTSKTLTVSNTLTLAGTDASTLNIGGGGTLGSAAFTASTAYEAATSAFTGKTYNGLTLTAAATGFTVAGGTTSKTLTVSNTLTLAGTDASTLNIGGGGTLGSAAFTASTAYQAPIGTISGVVKGNGANALTAAVAGTDYQAPIGTISGVVKGNGANALTAAVAGTDYVAPGTATTYTATQTFKGVVDTVYAITDGAAFQIDPANGSIQTVTLGANRVPAASSFAAGQAVLLGIDDGTGFTIDFATTMAVVWVKPGGTASAPTLATSGYNWVLLWKVGTTIYGSSVGSP